MVFSSVTFLFFFLPAVLGAYYVVPRRGRNAVLVLASLAFYTWGAGSIVFALIGSVAANFVIGLRLEQAHDRGDATRARRWLAVGVVINLALLGWFKYANFGVATWNGAVEAFGAPGIPWAAIVLPIGISFYTFHALSYLMDIHRGSARHLESPIDFVLYITFFPQLIAGPIVRFHEIRDQLVERQETVDAFAAGIYRFSLGLGKKVLIADAVAPVANAAFGTPTGELTMFPAALGVIAYAVQLYFDFSGYSDMALGLALMFGIRLPENFDRPYAARSVTEFWRRWHMSLSRWFRDYLYVPLGGNRGSARATYRNLVIVFLVTGLWHGANWTFVLWGAYHGILLLLERISGAGRGAGIRPAGWQIVTVVLVVLGWVLFRSPTLDYAAGYYAALLRPGLILPLDVRVALDPLATACLVFGAGSVLLPRTWVTGVRLENPLPRAHRVLRLVVIGVVLPAALVFVISGTFSPFLYFQF
ncbi:MAG TPA: MBOAT family protein [Candidatus Limnocylindrales bacterium]|nr:MBOAT family protein [Candidatus Limnocylindrales bacterium]